MSIEFHPDAKKNFDDKAHEICSRLKEEEEPAQSEAGFSPDGYISETYTEEDIIGGLSLGAVNYAGEEVAKYLHPHKGRKIAIEGEDYARCAILADSMQATSALKNRVSRDFVKDTLFEWLEARHSGGTSNTFTDFLCEKADEAIKSTCIWLPIAKTHVQHQFSIGQRVTIRPITTAQMDEWDENWEVPEEFADKKRIYMERRRKQLQGLAAAVIEVVGELQRSEEIAVDHVEKVLSLLRFYSPANFDPRLVSYCTLLGSENEERRIALFSSGTKLVHVRRGFTDPSAFPWALRSAQIAAIRQAGLDKLALVLEKPDKTDFQSDVLGSLLLYSRSSLTKDISGKLVYIFAAMESILLRDTTEPIQQNLADRVAFLVSQDADRRMEVANLLKKVYGLRSSFVHHGRQITDLELLKNFMKTAWDFFHRLIRNIDQFPTKKDLLDTIDRMKFS